MAKHAHRLLLNQKKTWRCTLPNCRYFIHIGLAHILPGQQSVCWECGDEFTLDERALTDDMPKCISCHNKASGYDLDAMEAYTNERIALAKAGAKSLDELPEMKRKTMEALGIIKPSKPRPSIVAKSPVMKDEEDQIEVIEAHSPDCAVYDGLDCTCK